MIHAVVFAMLGAATAGCTATQRESNTLPIVERDAPSVDWQAPMQMTAEYFMGWSEVPLRRIQLRPVHASMRYWMQVQWSENAAGPLHRATAFVLGGALIWKWTRQSRAAALRQFGLPKHKPPAAQVARFLEGTELFGSGFPGFWDPSADAPRAHRQARWVGDALQIDYESVDGGRAGGITAPTKRRIEVRFDGQALRVARTTR